MKTTTFRSVHDKFTITALIAEDRLQIRGERGISMT